MRVQAYRASPSIQPAEQNHGGRRRLLGTPARLSGHRLATNDRQLLHHLAARLRARGGVGDFGPALALAGVLALARGSRSTLAGALALACIGPGALHTIGKGSGGRKVPAAKIAAAVVIIKGLFIGILLEWRASCSP